TFNSNGIDGSLKTPYSIAMDLSVQRQLQGGFTFEAAYVGRRGRHLLQQLDLAAATDLVDPKSGMDYFTAATLMTQFALAHGEDKPAVIPPIPYFEEDRKSTRLNSSHQIISYAVFCLKKKNAKSARHNVSLDYCSYQE